MVKRPRRGGHGAERAPYAEGVGSRGLLVLLVALWISFPDTASPAGAGEPVPAPLLRRLLATDIPSRASGSDSLELVRDRPPLELVELVPEDAEFVGALEWSGGFVALFDVPAPKEEVAQRFRRRLDEAGLEPAPPPRGGFHVRSVEGPSIFCGGGRALSVEVTALAEEASGIEIQRKAETKRCRPPSAGSSRPPMPVLRGPAGAAVSTLTSGGGTDDYHSKARFLTDTSPYVFADFFGPQLAEQNWAGGDLLDLGDLAFQPFTYQSDDGTAWLGVLTVFVGDDEEDLHAEFRVQRVGLR